MGQKAKNKLSPNDNGGKKSTKIVFMEQKILAFKAKLLLGQTFLGVRQGLISKSIKSCYISLRRYILNPNQLQYYISIISNVRFALLEVG